MVQHPLDWEGFISDEDVTSFPYAGLRPLGRASRLHRPIGVKTSSSSCSGPLPASGRATSPSK